MRLPETDYITSTEAAKRLGVDQTRIQTWFHWGVLPENRMPRSANSGSGGTMTSSAD